MTPYQSKLWTQHEKADSDRTRKRKEELRKLGYKPRSELDIKMEIVGGEVFLLLPKNSHKETL